MTRLIFVRHGYSEGNLLGEFHGHMDGDLTELGHKQAECAGLYLRNRKIDVAYSSDLRRAYKTALHITKYHDIEPIKDESLREIYAGEWEGKKFSELERDYPELYRTWRTNPSEFVSIGGESMRELYDRIKAEVERIADSLAVTQVKHRAFNTRSVAVWYESIAYLGVSIRIEFCGVIKDSTAKSVKVEICVISE